jgi:hypothetical protein
MYVWSVHSQELLYFLSLSFHGVFIDFLLIQVWGQSVSQQISISKYREFLTNLLLQTLLLLQHLHLQLEFFSQLEPWFSWRAFMCCCCCCCCVFFSLWGGDLSIWRLHRWHRQSPEYIPRSSITDTTRIPSAKTHKQNIQQLCEITCTQILS